MDQYARFKILKLSPCFGVIVFARLVNDDRIDPENISSEHFIILIISSTTLF